MRKFLVCTGPGATRTIIYGDYTEEASYTSCSYTEYLADTVKEAIQADLDEIKKESGTSRGLIDYCDTAGVENLEFKDVIKKNDMFYLTWILTVNDDFQDEDLETFKDWITGQMSDGWGEGFEQHPISTDHYEENVEVDEYDEETGETNYVTERDRITEELYFSPWHYSSNPDKQFKVEIEELDGISEAQEKLTEAHKYWAILTQDQKYARWKPEKKYTKKQEAFDQAEVLQDMGLAVSVYQYKKLDSADTDKAGWQWVKVKTYPRLSTEELVQRGLEKRGMAPETFKFNDLEISDTADDYVDAYMEATKVETLRKPKTWRFNESKFQNKVREAIETEDGELDFSKLTESTANYAESDGDFPIVIFEADESMVLDDDAPDSWEIQYQYDDAIEDFERLEDEMAIGDLGAWDVRLEDGYYYGIQVLIKDKDEYEDYSEEERAKETEKVNEFLDRLVKEYGWQKIRRVASFSNGEAIYEPIREAKLTENSKDPYKLAKKYNLDVFELRGIDVSNDPAMTTYITIAPDHRVSGSWTICLTDTEEIKASQKRHQNGNWLVAVHKPFQYYADACDWLEQHIDRNDTLEGDPILSESKLKESYTDPDLLDDLVKTYIHNDMITSDEIWDEIMAQYDDEYLAGDVLAELDAEGWHSAFEESKLRESRDQIDLLYCSDGFKRGRGGRGFAKSNHYAVQCTHPDNVYNDLKYYLKQDGNKVYHQFRVNVRPCALENALDNSISVEEFMKRYEAGEFNDEFKESKLREATSGLKITNVSVEPKWIYDTYKGPIRVKANINGKEALFSFEAARSGNIFFAGVDCNSAVVLKERDEDMPAYLRYSRGITISNGGTQTHYALQIHASTLKAAPKENQKDFLFTGRNYSTKPVKEVFKQKLEALYQNNDLTQEFLDTFEIPPYGTNPISKSSDSVEKMKKWQSGERGFNLKAASDAKLKANLKICREIGFDEGADKIQAELNSRKTNALDESISVEEFIKRYEAGEFDGLRESKLKEGKASEKGWYGYEPEETFNRIDNRLSSIHGKNRYLTSDDFSDLRKDYIKKLRDQRAEYAKAHPEYNDEYNAYRQWIDPLRNAYWDIENKDPELKDMIKKYQDAARYRDYSQRKGWLSTVKKQQAIMDQLDKDIKARKKLFDPYNPESDVYKTKPMTDHIDAYWNIENPLIDEYEAEQDRREQEFADALKDKKIYLGSLEGDDGKISKAFFRNTDDPKVFRRIGSRGSSSQPYGPYRGYTKFFISPDPRTEFEDYPEDKIKDLREFDPYGWESNGELDSTD